MISSCATIAFAFSGVLAYKLSGPLSELIFSSFLYDSMQTSFNEILSDISAETTHNGQLLALTEALPEGFVKIWEGFGFNLDNLLNTSMQADYPSNEVMDRILEYGAILHRTDTDGNVVLRGEK